MWLFSTRLFKDNDSIKELFDSPLYIKEQFVWRLHKMEESEQGKKCLEKGECICGCDVPDLQLVNDACEGGCYPEMMNHLEWENYKFVNHFKVDVLRQKVIKYV